VTAGIMLMLSGLSSWVVSQPAVRGEGAVAQAVDELAFITGGVGFVVGLGLLIAGLAVPGLLARLLPGWLCWAGLVLAFLSEVSFFALLTPAADFLLPIGRFLGLIWLVIAGFLLPRPRVEVRDRERPNEAFDNSPASNTPADETDRG